MGTLYRGFPTREALLEGLNGRSFLLVLDATEEARSTSNPGLLVLAALIGVLVSAGRCFPLSAPPGIGR